MLHIILPVDVDTRHGRGEDDACDLRVAVVAFAKVCGIGSALTERVWLRVTRVVC